MKKRDHNRISKGNFDWRVQLALPVVVACAVSGISIFGEYLVKTSAINEKCLSLESDLKVEKARVIEKNELIVNHRARISTLEGMVQLKSNELSIKDSVCELYKVKYYEKTGKMLSKDSDLCQAIVASNSTHSSGNEGCRGVSREEAKRLLTAGSVAERLGLSGNLSMRDKVKKGWSVPLMMEQRPGVFLRAPDGVLEAGLAMIDALCTNDIDQVVVAAHKAHRLLSPLIDPVVLKSAEIDVRLAQIVSMAYHWVAEDEFSRGNFRNAAYLIGTAAGVVGPNPAPFLLAKESAIQYRSMNGKSGYFTNHIADATKYNNDPNYFYEIHNELAKLGYLQLYYPNASGTDLGEKIDWTKIFKGKRLQLRSTYEKNGDIWSTRWIGLGKYEEYNLSAEFRHMVKMIGKGAQLMKSK